MARAAPALIPLFRSEAQLRLVGEIFMAGEPELSIHELVRLTRVPQATVSREVSRLEEHGLLKSRRLGNTRLVSANWDLPWAGELRSILAQTVGVLASLAEELEEVDRIGDAYIYGSWAARYIGEAGPFPRDVDVLIVGDPDRTDVMRAARSVERHLRIAVNTIVVDPQIWAAPEAGSFYEQVKNGPLVPIPRSEPT